MKSGERAGDDPGGAPSHPGAAHAHAGVVCTLVWYRDALDALGRWETAQRVRSLSARLARHAPTCPLIGVAVDALRESVRELAKARPDGNRMVALLGHVTDAAGHVPGTSESVKRIIARLARPGSGASSSG